MRDGEVESEGRSDPLILPSLRARALPLPTKWGEGRTALRFDGEGSPKRVTCLDHNSAHSNNSANPVGPFIMLFLTYRIRLSSN